MFGPKLDAKSYAILVLAVVGTLFTMNLQSQNEALSGADSSREVAAATREVARANTAIAASIDRLAAAVAKIELKVPAPGAPEAGTGATTPTAATVGTGGAALVSTPGTSAEPSDSGEDAGLEPEDGSSVGTFEIR